MAFTSSPLIDAQRPRVTVDKHGRLQIPAVWTGSAMRRSCHLLTLRSLRLRYLTTNDPIPSTSGRAKLGSEQ